MADRRKPEAAVPEFTGLSVNYYKVPISHPTSLPKPYVAECNDIIEGLQMNYAEGNILKALWRSCASTVLGLKKRGQDEDGVYDAEKMVFFSKQILKQRLAERKARQKLEIAAATKYQSTIKGAALTESTSNGTSTGRIDGTSENSGNTPKPGQHLPDFPSIGTHSPSESRN